MSALGLKKLMNTDPAFRYLGRNDEVFVVRENGNIEMCRVNWEIVKCGASHLVKTKTEWKALWGFLRFQVKQAQGGQKQ